VLAVPHRFLIGWPEHVAPQLALSTPSRPAGAPSARLPILKQQQRINGRKPVGSQRPGEDHLHAARSPDLVNTEVMTIRRRGPRRKPPVIGPRVNPLRTTTWRRLLQAHAETFLAWLASTGKRFEVFDRLAGALEDFLLQHVLAGNTEFSANESCMGFANALPLVFSRCNEAIYDQSYVAEGYAFVYLLERYRRFTQILDVLLRAGILPMRDQGVDVLDVGVGPGAALYAASDFYDQLAEYARQHEIDELKTPLPRLSAFESSWRMGLVMHWISELRGQPQFHRPFGPFDGVDFEVLRERRRDELFMSALDSDDPLEALSALPDYKNEWRFNLGIFSYVLTQEAMVTKLSRELEGLFRSMRAGGVVVTLGGIREYRKVYKAVDKIARRELMERRERPHSRMRLVYTDPYTARIKELYRRIWQHLEAHAIGLDAVKSQLPKDLWNADAPLTGPAGFGLRIFRRLDITPSKGSFQKAKASMERR